MISSKRSSLSSSKSSKYNGKLKEILSSSSSSSRPKTTEPKVPDIKDFSNVPIIEQIDDPSTLPKYTAIFLINGEEGVAMDDLDQLQQDLEKLLSINAIRTRFFLGEHSQADQKDGQNDKRTHDKTSLKRKRPDEKPKFKDLKNGLRVVKRDPFKSFSGNSCREIPKITLPRNDNTDKFYASIEAYCAPVNKDNLAFLDLLIQEFSKKIDKKIPDIGDHYASSWSEELINDEQNLGKGPNKKPNDFRKNGLHTMVESFGAPHTQRLLSALVQERALKLTNPVNKHTENGVKIHKMKASELTKMKHNIGQKDGTCLDKRLLKELVEQGILTNEDVTKNIPGDEILAEMKKCQKELLTVNRYNLEELNKLRSAVMNDIHCNQLKDDLDKIDKEVLDLYSNIMVARLREDEVFREDLYAAFGDRKRKYISKNALSIRRVLFANLIVLSGINLLENYSASKKKFM